MRFSSRITAACLVLSWMVPRVATAEDPSLRLEFGAGAAFAIGEETLDDGRSGTLLVDAVSALTITPESLSRRTGAALAGRVTLDLFDLTVRETGDLQVFAGVQGFGLWAANGDGRFRSELSTIGFPPTVSSGRAPVNGKQTVLGAAGILGWTLAAAENIHIRGYGGVGAARSRLRFETAGFAELDDSAIVPAFVAGLGVFRRIGAGWELGATLDYTRVAGFDVEQASSVRSSVFGPPVTDSRIGARDDLIVGLAVRYELPEFGF